MGLFRIQFFAIIKFKYFNYYFLRTNLEHTYTYICIYIHNADIFIAVLYTNVKVPKTIIEPKKKQQINEFEVSE